MPKQRIANPRTRAKVARLKRELAEEKAKKKKKKKK